MEALKSVSARFPEAAKDIRLNLQGVLAESSLSERLRWTVALACAFASRNREVREAVLQDGAAFLDDAALDDARAASALMAMNNVYYRFRHMIGKPEYAQMPARLRMNRIAQHKLSKPEFELVCLAVSAIHGCEMCVLTHEKAVIDGQLTTAHVHDAVRIAATIHAAAVVAESL